MTLTYRGQAYTVSNRPETVKSQSFLSYRGQSYERSTSIAITPRTQLIYRGVSYTCGTPSEIAEMMGFEKHKAVSSCLISA